MTKNHSFEYEGLDPESIVAIKRSWMSWKKIRDELRFLFPLETAPDEESSFKADLIPMAATCDTSKVPGILGILGNLFKRLRSRQIAFNDYGLKLAYHTVYLEERIRHLEQEVQTLRAKDRAP